MNGQATMKISEEYANALRQKGLFEKHDVAKLAEITREHNMRGGRGYSGMMIRNYMFYGHPCTTEVYNIIISYFEEKQAMRDRLKQRAKAMIDSVAPAKLAS